MDKREREKFYASSADDDDDSGELELEPPDADVLASEARRGKEVVETSRVSIDIDEIYRDADHDRSAEILNNWFKGFRFQFQVKHLLIATAVLAIAMTLAKWDMLGTAVVLLVMFSIAGLYFWLQWQDKLAQDEANRRRQAMYARRRAHLRKMAGESSAEDEEESPTDSESLTDALGSADQAWQDAVEREPFRFRFSLSQLMVAMTTAAVILGVAQLLGDPAHAATIFGFVALIGLVAHAIGFEPPQMVVLFWWLILVLYVLLSIFAAVWSIA